MSTVFTSTPPIFHSVNFMTLSSISNFYKYVCMVSWPCIVYALHFSLYLSRYPLCMYTTLSLSICHLKDIWVASIPCYCEESSNDHDWASVSVGGYQVLWHMPRSGLAKSFCITKEAISPIKRSPKRKRESLQEIYLIEN